MRAFRVGGLTFLQVGQFSASWCFSKRREPFWTQRRIDAAGQGMIVLATAITLIRWAI